jgi:hypothetical protein
MINENIFYIVHPIYHSKVKYFTKLIYINKLYKFLIFK